MPVLAMGQTDSSIVYLDSISTGKADTIPQEKESIIQYRFNGTYLKSIYTDLKYTVSRPLHWTGRDFTRLGIVLGTTGVLMLGDREIKKIFQRNQLNAINSFAEQIEPFGNSYSPYLMGGAYLVGIITKDRKLEHGALMTGKSLVIATVVYGVLKSAIRRERPLYTDNNISFGTPFSKNKKLTSFPSGHTLTVTTVATAISELYGKDHPWVPWVAYSIAGLTGVSRLYHNRHWASDVWIGASLGHFVTKAVFKNSSLPIKKKGLLSNFSLQ